MSVEKRNCKFRDDPHDLKLFQEYSREACKLECLAHKILQACQCLPWDFLREENLQVGVPCYGKKFICPKAVVEENSNVGCDCPLDCDSIKYTYSIESEPWYAFDFCYLLDKEPGNLFGFHARWAYWRKELDYPESYDSITTEEQSLTVCEKVLKHGSRVTISYQDATATRMTKARRVTTVDLLANLGKMFQRLKLMDQNP